MPQTVPQNTHKKTPRDKAILSRKECALTIEKDLATLWRRHQVRTERVRSVPGVRWSSFQAREYGDAEVTQTREDGVRGV